MASGMRTTNDDKPAAAKKSTAKKAIGIVLKAVRPYHNGSIPGGVGANWRVDEEREVTWEQYEQICADSINAFERVN